MKKVLLFILLIFSANSYAKEACKRPRWKIVYNENLKCKMYYNHYILYNTSNRKPEIERKNGFCKVIKGHWKVKSYSGDVSVYYASDLNIDHILPYSYIVKQVGCKEAKKYFNLKYNLEPLEANYNKSKKDNVCHNKEYCLKQKLICLKIEEEFKKSLNCKNL